MTVIAGTQLTINDTTPQRIDVDETDYNPSTNTGSQNYGRVCTYKVSGPHHYGGSNTVTNSGGTRGALFDAGTYSRQLGSTDQVWLIAPSGQTITVERDTTGA